MANPKKVTLNMLVQEHCSNIHSKIPAERVVVDPTTGELLSARLKTIAERLESIGVPDTDEIARLEAEIKKIVGSAPDGYKSLGEIYEYINSLDAVVTSLHEGMANKVDKVVGKGLSTNDFTDYYKAKLDLGVSDGAFVETSTINGNILVNGEEITVYEHPTVDGWLHLPSGGNAGQFLAISESNTAAWVDVVPDSEKKVLSATKLESPREITFSGAFTSVAQFDGSSNVNFVVESVDATKLSGIIPWANLPEIIDGSFVQSDFLETDEASPAFIKNKDAVVDLVSPTIEAALLPKLEEVFLPQAEATILPKVEDLISKKVEFSGEIISGAFVIADADGNLVCTTEVPESGSASVVAGTTVTIEIVTDGASTIDVPEGVTEHFNLFLNGSLMVEDIHYTYANDTITLLGDTTSKGDQFTFISYSGTSNSIGIATAASLGLVKSASGPNKITVADDGTMYVSSLDMSCLVSSSGTEIILNGGSAS